MKRKLISITNNTHEPEEASSILADKAELFSLSDIDCHTDTLEAADTLEGSAYLKPSLIYQNYGLGCFSNDVGLEVEVLGRIPGVYSARFAGREGHNAEANILKLVQELEGKENRRTQSCTTISLILDGKEYPSEGVIKGEIIKEKRGSSGLGYDPVFIPGGCGRTFAELGDEIEGRISHRALAVNRSCGFPRSIRLIKTSR